MRYQGSCHCGAIRFSFEQAQIVSGILCNCSLCQRRQALMSAFVLAPEELSIEDPGDQLGEYRFGHHIAVHHFCRHCGVYPFHQTRRKPGHYRVNLGCVEGLDSYALPREIFDGRALD